LRPEAVQRARKHVGDSACEENGTAQRLAQALDAAHHVDRTADDREIEPFRRADVAEEDVAAVERDAGTKRPPAADVR